MVHDAVNFVVDLVVHVDFSLHGVFLILNGKG